MKKLLLVTSLLVVPALISGQSGQSGGLDPAEIMKPLADQWTSYSGDLSGKRFSALKLVNTNTVKNLSLKWVTSLTTGCGPTGTPPAGAAAGGRGGGRGGGGGAAAPIIVGGLGTGDANNCNNARLGGGILFVDGIIYASTPDNVYAIDARDGALLWHYYWKTRGGTHIGNRGLGMWHNYLFMETPDDYLVSLDARTGKERWHVVISDFNQQYFSTMAPIVVGNHLLVGTGDDLDAPGFLQSFDPDTGKLQWKFYTVPMKAGDPGLNTWPSLEAAQHGIAGGLDFGHPS